MEWPERWCAVALDGTANLSRSSTAHLCVIVSVESDEYPARTFISNGERPSAVLEVTFGITNVQHLLDLDWSLVCGFQLLDLAEYSVDVVEPAACLAGVVGG